jgi:CheY-like chemotaxis protein
MKKTMQILLVEDDPGDVILTKKMFENIQATLQLHVVGDGVEAMAYLRCEAPYTESPRPDLVLLDLNMPKKNGCEVLQEMRSDETLRPIPVVVLTTSDHDMDVNNAYRLGANSYITKPSGLAVFARVIESIEDFWFKTVQLPTK